MLEVHKPGVRKKVKCQYEKINVYHRRYNGGEKNKEDIKKVNI